MMPSNEISEKEFEFAFDHELINFVGENNLEIYMPTAAREAQEGFDARFDIGNPVIFTSLFFQFKRGSVYGNSTSDCGDPLEGHSGIKLRYSLHKQKYPVFHAQHNILKNLSNSGNSVFYASPSTTYRIELLEQMRLHTILDSSWIFDLSQFPHLPDNDNSTHRVYYPDTGTVGYFCSDSKEIQSTKIKSRILETNVPTLNADGGRELSEKYLNELLDKILKSVMPEYKPMASRKEENWDELGTVQKITQVLSDRLPDLLWVLVYKDTANEKLV